MYKDFEEILKEKGISAYSVAKEIHISQGILSSWKAGKSSPNNATLWKIANYLDVPMEMLMSEYLPQTNDATDIAKATRVGLTICQNDDLQELFEITSKMNSERLKAYLTFMKKLS